MAVEAAPMPNLSDAHSVSAAALDKERTAASTNSKRENKGSVIEVSMPISNHYMEKYPQLNLGAYDKNEPDVPHNVLTLVHNCTKREIADLLTVVLPAITQYSGSTGFMGYIKNSDSFGDKLYQWWSTSLRMFFFTAEIDEDIMKFVIDAMSRLAREHHDVKLSNELTRRRKSVLDRYAYNMEVVLRAAERALDEYENGPDEERLLKLVSKFEAVGLFMLETMEMSMEVVKSGEDILEMEITRLEHSVVNSLWKFGKSESSLFIYTMARWMEDKDCIREWIRKFGGLRGRWMFASWKRRHYEKRAGIIERIAADYPASSVE